MNDISEITIKPGTTFKKISRWASLSKDIFASVKDFGIIVFVILIIFFREPVLNFLNKNHIKVSSVDVFGIQAELDSLQFAGDAKQLSTIVTEEKLSSPQIEKAVTEIKATSSKVEEIENKILSSPEATVISDWAIVVGGQPTLDQAKITQSSVDFGNNLTANIFKKRNYFRLVVQVDSKDDVKDALKIVRSKFPDAYLVSLARWCGNITADSEYISCSAL